MSSLRDRVQHSLYESRILILGTQVLVGFDFRSAFENGFEKLPRLSQYAKLGSLALLVVALALLIAPAAYHRIVEEGEDTEGVHAFTTRLMAWALLPFALGLGVDLYVATEKVSGRALAIVAGLVTALTALFFWYGLEAVQKVRRRDETGERQAMAEQNNEQGSGGTELKDKIDHLLTENRMVLPGAQALLGFQFATMLAEGFDKLPASSKYVHLASLGLMALSIVLLMAPAAYHRIVEQGEDTEHFHRLAGRMVLAAMVPLALGIAGDFFVVVRKVAESTGLALAGAGLVLVLFYGLWFGFTLLRRNQRGLSRRTAMEYRGPQPTG